jgi:hypothetical protein
VSRDSQASTPVAAHRLAPRGWLRIFTFLAVFATFGGLAYGAIWYLDQSDEDWEGWWEWLPFVGSDDPSPSPSASTTASPSSTVSAAPSPTTSANYNFAVQVTIYNASGVEALGPEIAALLAGSSEFTLIDSQAWGGALPPANVVRYQDPALSDTAALIAEILGVQTVNTGPTEGPAIAVILVTDPRPQPKVTPTATPSTSAAP